MNILLYADSLIDLSEVYLADPLVVDVAVDDLTVGDDIGYIFVGGDPSYLDPE